MLRNCTFRVFDSANGIGAAALTPTFVLLESLNPTTGTASAGGASSLTLASGQTFATNVLAGTVVHIIGGADSGDSGTVASNTNANPSVLTMVAPWATATNNTSAYKFFPNLLTNPGPPIVVESGNSISAGLYSFYWDAESTEIRFVIDAGSSLAPADRWVIGTMTCEGSRIVAGISAAGAVTLPQPPPSGYGSSAGSGPMAINHNTGGTDNLRYVERSGAGIGGASVLIYQAGDWPANPSRVQAVATTGPNGRWVAPAFVSAGTYVAVFTIIGADGPDVSAPFTV